MSGEEAGEASTLARLASSLWMAEASEVGLAAEPGTERTPIKRNAKEKRGAPEINAELKTGTTRGELRGKKCTEHMATENKT